MRIDLNCDMGEAFGNYSLGLDHEIIKHITSANIACGWHAGDPVVMERTVAMAAANGVGAGAHPGYPDLLGFGRRNMDCTPEELKAYVIYQIGPLMAFCAANGIRLQHVKPHGALYNTLVKDLTLARAVGEAIAAVDKGFIWVCLAGSAGDGVAQVGRELGLTVAREFFPDRAYTPEGALANRKLPGAVIHDPQMVAERALLVAKEGKVIAIDGSEVAIEADTFCVHGDNPTAVDLVKAIKESLEAAGVDVKPMGAAD